MTYCQGLSFMQRCLYLGELIESANHPEAASRLMQLGILLQEALQLKVLSLSLSLFRF